jgi:hypothetical protein
VAERERKRKQGKKGTLFERRAMEEREEKERRTYEEPYILADTGRPNQPLRYKMKTATTMSERKKKKNRKTRRRTQQVQEDWTK